MKDAIQPRSVFDAKTQEQKVALITSPSLPDGIGGFVLDIAEDHTVELDSDITDHYTERNSTIHDHMAIRPEIITVRGFVGELVALKRTAESVAAQSREALPDAPGLSPELSPGEQEAFEASDIPVQPTLTPFSEFEASTKATRSALPGARYGFLQPEGTGRRQADAFSYCYSLWRGRQFVTVETPWGVFPTTLVQSIRVNQAGDTRYRSEFTVTFKAIRFASDIVVLPAQDGRAKEQSAETTPVGRAGQSPVLVHDIMAP